MNLADLRERAIQGFCSTFGTDPDLISIAPGRTNLIGEHTDYHDGFVFPAAIDRYVVVAARKADRSRIVSEGFGDSGSFQLSKGLPDLKWLRYACGSAILWQNEKVRMPEVDAYAVTNLPVGSGLSSSAATEVAFAQIYDQLVNLRTPKKDLARHCQAVENIICQVPSGIMDQTASLFGKRGCALFIDTRTLDVKPVPIPSDVKIVICDTGEHHDIGESGYPLRRSQSESAAAKIGVRVLREANMDMLKKSHMLGDALSDDEFRRAKHIITENARCEAFYRALLASDLGFAGGLMRESHISMRDDYEITTPLLDRTAEFCWSFSGCIGARMTGGGFGGAVVALVAVDKVQKFSEAVAGFFSGQMASNSKVFECLAADGAVIEQLS